MALFLGEGLVVVAGHADDGCSVVFYNQHFMISSLIDVELMSGYHGSKISLGARSSSSIVVSVSVLELRPHSSGIR